MKIKLSDLILVLRIESRISYYRLNIERFQIFGYNKTRLVKNVKRESKSEIFLLLKHSYLYVMNGIIILFVTLHYS